MYWFFSSFDRNPRIFENQGRFSFRISFGDLIGYFTSSSKSFELLDDCYSSLLAFFYLLISFLSFFNFWSFCPSEAFSLPLTARFTSGSSGLRSATMAAAPGNSFPCLGRIGLMMMTECGGRYVCRYKSSIPGAGCQGISRRQPRPSRK